MNANHTPAPWSWDDNILRPASNSTRIHTIINDDGCTVYRQTQVDEFNPEIEANKRLIAAAPELLAALEEITADAEINVITFRVIDLANAAIAKARGAA